MKSAPHGADFIFYYAVFLIPDEFRQASAGKGVNEAVRRGVVYGCSLLVGETRYFVIAAECDSEAFQNLVQEHAFVVCGHAGLLAFVFRIEVRLDAFEFVVLVHAECAEP